LSIKVIEYLFNNYSDDGGIIIFKSIRRSPGFTITKYGNTKKEITTDYGIPFIIEKTIKY
jgi:hypothetical protein